VCQFVIFKAKIAAKTRPGYNASPDPIAGGEERCCPSQRNPKATPVEINHRFWTTSTSGFRHLGFSKEYLMTTTISK